MALSSLAGASGRVRRAVWRRLEGLAGAGRDAPVILMYHRIASPPYDPWGQCVDPQRFREQAAALKAHRTLMSMDELVEGIAAGRLPPRAAALTLDDGYRDNAEIAKPILEELGAPATMFLTTGLIGSDRPFWWDELAQLVLASGRGAKMELQAAGRTLSLSWDRQPAVPPDLARWRFHHETGDPRRRAYVELWRALQPLDSAERESALAQLREHLADGTVSDALGVPLSRDAAGLLASPLICLGGHGRSHVPLPSLPRDQLEAEIAGCRADIAEIDHGRAASGFAYPHGEWNAAAREAVARAGFRWAVSTRPAKIDEGRDDLLALPRVHVGNWSGRSLLLRLRLMGRGVRAGGRAA